MSDNDIFDLGWIAHNKGFIYKVFGGYYILEKDFEDPIWEMTFHSSNSNHIGSLFTGMITSKHFLQLLMDHIIII